MGSVAVAGAGSAAAQRAPSITPDAVANISAAHGIKLTEDRVRVLQPVLDRRLAQLQALRDFDIEDGVAPTQGISSR